jgi:hypothetical protein
MRNDAKKRAKKKGLPFDIELDDIIIPDICPLLGIRLAKAEGGAPAPHSPSLDRIIPELGYVRGNIQVLSYLANSMKQNATTEQLITFAHNILSLYNRSTSQTT